MRQMFLLVSVLLLGLSWAVAQDATQGSSSPQSGSSAGSGSAPHIGCVLLNTAIGTDITHVPYRGSGPAMQDLIAGRTDFFCEALPTALSQIQSGTVKAIGLLARDRAKVLPSLPTAQEQGLAGFEAYTWFGFYLPHNTPHPIVRRLHQATVEATETPWVRGRLEDLGAALVSTDRSTPEYLATFMRSEMGAGG